jgi:nitrogen-specific signal transduction histidine kinase/CheY-like chemotaxis protein
VVVFAQDVSHETALEQQLRESLKMRALGTLAGGIAHDFNNILFAAIGYSQLALEEVGANETLRDYMEQILAGQKRAVNLVQRILTFSRQRSPERSHVRLQPIVEEALSLLAGALPEQVALDVDLDADVDDVHADSTELHQVVMNLCSNAIHSMRDSGGTLTVTIDAVQTGGMMVPSFPNLPGGRYARLTVADTGHGMEAGTVERIFEPYFSTKSSGEGTGLGLSTVHGIVNELGGAVEVHSRPGAGSRFSVYLPAHPAGGMSFDDEAVETPPGDLEESDETIRVMFVDDEDAIRQMMGLALPRHDCAVDLFGEPLKALEQFESTPGAWDVVVTDQTMPALLGTEMVRRMRETNPDVPVILCTGFAHAVSQEECDELGIRYFIRKPMYIADLVHAIRKSTRHRAPRD